MEWQDIETAPKDDGVPLLGYDEVTAALHGKREAGLCIIRWVEADEDDDWDEGWEVMPLAEGLDCVLSETNITKWAPWPEPPK